MLIPRRLNALNRSPDRSYLTGKCASRLLIVGDTVMVGHHF